MKYCKKCFTEKPLDQYFNNRLREDGKSYYCKACEKACSKAAYDKKRDKYLEYRRNHYVANKEQYKANRERWTAENHDKILIDHKQYYQDHRDERMAYQRDYYRENTSTCIEASYLRRMRLQEQMIEKVDRQVVFERDAGVCGICWSQGFPGIVDPNDWHLDHIIPISRGGAHSYQNVQVSHPLCNRRKHASVW